MTVYTARVDKSTHSDGYQVHTLVSIDSFLAHSCWKQWMRYRGGADVDGSYRPWTEVVFRGRNFHCGPWTEVVSHATPPYLVKVKINFHEAQKLNDVGYWSNEAFKCYCGSFFIHSELSPFYASSGRTIKYLRFGFKRWRCHCKLA